MEEQGVFWQNVLLHGHDTLLLCIVQQGTSKIDLRTNSQFLPQNIKQRCPPPCSHQPNRPSSITEQARARCLSKCSCVLSRVMTAVGSSSSQKKKKKKKQLGGGSIASAYHKLGCVLPNWGTQQKYNLHLDDWVM